MKKVLYVIPDYNRLTLRMVNALKAQEGIAVYIVAPFRFNGLLKWMAYAGKDKITFLKKIYRRYEDWQKVRDGKNIKIISISFMQLLKKFFVDKKTRTKFNFENFFKGLLENELSNTIDFKAYDYLYCFDTCALVYLSKGKKQNPGIVTILESRASHIDYAVSVNEQINTLFGIQLRTGDPPGKHWFWKLREEPKYSDYVVVYSDFHKKQFYNILSQDKVLKIPLACNFVKQQKASDSENDKRYDSKVLNFIYVGAINHRKGCELLLNAWRNLNRKYQTQNFQLTFVGKPSAEMQKVLKDVPSNVFLKGFLFHDELEKELQKADVFIFPSFNDSFGLVVLEAMAFNLPVITTKNCGASDFIKDGYTGKIINDAFSEVEVMEKIEYFIANPDEIDKMTANLAREEMYEEKDEIYLASEQFRKVFRQDNVVNMKTC